MSLRLFIIFFCVQLTFSQTRDSIPTEKEIISDTLMTENLNL